MVETEVANKIVELYEGGKPIREIADILWVNYDAVRKHLHKAGVVMRSPGLYSPSLQKKLGWKPDNSITATRRLAWETLQKAGVSVDVCHNCGRSLLFRLHNIHHIDGDWSNNSIKNLQILCVRCHNSGWKGAKHFRRRDMKGRFV